MNSSPPPMDADPSFVPRLDARQRAMLAEMGVKVWAPKPTPPADAIAKTTGPVASEASPRTASPMAVPVPARAPLAAAPASVREAVPRPAAAPAPVRHPVTAALGARPVGIDGMDWPALQAAVTG